MRLRGALVVVAVFWALSAWAFADQPTCRDDSGLLLPCSEVSDNERLPVRDVPDFPVAIPVPKDTHADSDFALDAGVGGVASLSSEASAVEPTAEINAAFDLATNDKSPRLALLAAFRALPGETVSLADPATFRSLGLEGTLSQPLWSNLRLRPAILLGAEFRFAGDEAPLHRAARYAYLGTRMDGDAGYLFLGVGGDERLSTASREAPDYLPAANVSWGLRMGKITGAIDARLVGRVLLYLRLGYGATTAGSDVAQLGVLVGFGARR